MKRTNPPHLFIFTSDFKRNGPHENAPFSDSLFHARFLGIICFVATVSFKKHFLVAGNDSTANKKLLYSLFNGFYAKT